MAEKGFFIFLQTFLFLALINSISNESYSDIHLIIRGSEVQTVINSGFISFLSEVYIDGEKKTEVASSYELIGETSNITLRFNS